MFEQFNNTHKFRLQQYLSSAVDEFDSYELYA